jgi:septum formation protein
MEPIILISSSPQVRDYFKILHLPFNTMTGCAGKEEPEKHSPADFAALLAKNKLEQVRASLSDKLPYWICSIETIVATGNTITGRITDRQAAKKILESLSGREHEVITAIALFNGRTRETDERVASSRVSFDIISDMEIEWYLNTGEWQGAISAYKIDGLGACFVKEICGSHSSIAGLPVHVFYKMLVGNGYSLSSSL